MNDSVLTTLYVIHYGCWCNNYDFHNRKVIECRRDGILLMRLMIKRARKS